MGRNLAVIVSMTFEEGPAVRRTGRAEFSFWSHIWEMWLTGRAGKRRRAEEKRRETKETWGEQQRASKGWRHHSERKRRQRKRHLRQKRRRRGRWQMNRGRQCGPDWRCQPQAVSARGLLAERPAVIQVRGRGQSWPHGLLGAAAVCLWYSDGLQLSERKLTMNYWEKPQISFSPPHFPQGRRAEGRKDGMCNVIITHRAIKSVGKLTREYDENVCILV